MGRGKEEFQKFILNAVLNWFDNVVIWDVSQIAENIA